MLIRELTEPGAHGKNLKGDLMDFLSAYKHDGDYTVPVSGSHGSLAYLRRLGYAIDAPVLMGILENPPFTDMVERSDQKIIKLKPALPDYMVSNDEMEDSQKAVDKMATKAAMKAVKSGDNL